MSIRTYEIPYFIGIDQSNDENRLSPAYSPDAANMDTEGGMLRVAKGYTRFSDAKLPGDGTIDMLCCMRTSGGDIPVAVSGGRLYALLEGEWVEKYAYQDQVENASYDYATVRIGMSDYLIIADGRHRMIKFDGQTVSLFGSSGNYSDIAVGYLTMYRGRLFAAGDSENPDRLYYSVLPGSGRTIEDWGSVEASPAVEGGHVEVGPAGGDPIVAIKALSNQLLIFKKHGLYRLIGDRPSNFTIEHIDASVPKTAHTAIAVYGDMLYFVTKDGLYYYNGVTARPCPDMRAIKLYMDMADVEKSRSVINSDRLYFTYKLGSSDEMMVYDLTSRKYMRRNGFAISDIAASDGKLLLINDRRRLYEFECGTSYDGNAIEAYWCTPRTDLSNKAAIKAPKLMLIRGSGDALCIEVELDGKTRRYATRLDEKGNASVREVPLFNEGRCMRLRFSNRSGGSFVLEGGVEIELALRRRTE